LKKRNPITILEESLSSLKDYFDGEITNEKYFFDGVFVQSLEDEAKKIKEACNLLNNDLPFIQQKNNLVNLQNSKGFLYKAEHFLISDFIQLYKNNLDKETEKSRFVLAYFYDALKNNHFADQRAINTLNKLVASDEFRIHLQTIISDNLIQSIEDKKPYFFSDVLTELNPFQKFLEFAFNLKLNKEELAAVFKDKQSKMNSATISSIPEEDTLEKVMEELNELIGLDEVKNDISELINLLNIQKERSNQGLKNIEVTLHTVFLGPPGTGKTSVARLLSRIYKHLGFLSKGQMIETDREGLIAGFVGQTATKVDKVVTESLGGVLFIDEAYGLTQNTMGNDYGAEAVNTILKRMEDHRDDLAVVVAGYTEPMKMFIESNPGLRSRFNRFFHFDHFTPTQMLKIFETFCKKSDFLLDVNAKEKLSDTFELLFEKKDESFGNARVVRNLFEKCVQNQANRIVKLKKLTPKTLKLFTEADIPEPKETLEQANFTIL
jgi:stage V sporulation protein K